MNLQATVDNEGRIKFAGGIPFSVPDKQAEKWFKEAIQDAATQRANELMMDMMWEITAFNIETVCSLLEIKDKKTIKRYMTADKKDPKFLPVVDGGERIARVRAIDLKEWLIRNGKESEKLAGLMANANTRVNR